jgi:hypothetical protein
MEGAHLTATGGLNKAAQSLAWCPQQPDGSTPALLSSKIKKTDKPNITDSPTNPHKSSTSKHRTTHHSLGLYEYMTASEHAQFYGRLSGSLLTLLTLITLLTLPTL